MKLKTKGRHSAILQFHSNNLLLVQHRIENKEVWRLCLLVLDDNVHFNSDRKYKPSIDNSQR